MGKRSDFPRRKNDLYETPKEAVLPLLPFLITNVLYYEPCVGNGALIRHLAKHGHLCVGGTDKKYDARVVQYRVANFDYFITNPPWTRQLLHPIIENLADQKPTWLLFDAGWMHTKQARPYLKYCQKIVSVGRIKWIPGTQHASKDDCCWYHFWKGNHITGNTIFYNED